jgi:hypothetical protein
MPRGRFSVSLIMYNLLSDCGFSLRHEGGVLPFELE